MSILVCIGIPGRRKICIRYGGEYVRLKFNTQVAEVQPKPRCDEELKKFYAKDSFFSERRRQELKTLRAKPTRKPDIAEIYQLVVNSLEKHI